MALHWLTQTCKICREFQALSAFVKQPKFKSLKRNQSFEILLAKSATDGVTDVADKRAIRYIHYKIRCQ